MKIFIIIFLIVFSAQAFSQTNNLSSAKRKNKSGKAVSHSTTKNNYDTAGTQIVQPRETATDKYLKGPERKNSDSSATFGDSSGKSPFAGGIYEPEKSAKKVNTTNTNNASTGVSSTGTIAVAADTVYNRNTIIQNGITTTSGAVDRSGQSQFGQTNWGDSRSTVGESQWTVPPPVSASFVKEFPAANAATWTRNRQDSSIYSARYRSGTTWITSNYNAHGERLDMRTEVPLPQTSRPVSIYLAKQPADFQITTVSRLQILGKPDIFEIQTKTGKTIYINNEGVEVNY